MQPPAVQDLNSLIGQYTTALAPEKTQLDTQITANDTSGQQQAQGLDAAKTQAFGDITQQANDRGGYFSGFSPDAQAKYTAATYLPALAQLQTTIAGTRSSLLGKEADLTTQANTSALTQQQQEQSDLEKYNEQQQANAQAAAATAQQEQFTAGENAKDRAATAANNNASISASNASKAVSPDSAALGIITAGLGSDGYVSPSTFETARKLYVQAGGSASDFANQYWKYTGVKNANGAAGKNASNWQAYYYG